MIVKMSRTDVEAFFERLFCVCECKSYTALAYWLGFTPDFLLMRKRQRRIPSCILSHAQVHFNVNPEWLLTGTGSQLFNQFPHILVQEYEMSHDVALHEENVRLRAALRDLEAEIIAAHVIS